MSNFGLPPKPVMPGPNASDVDRLRYQQEMQNYQFALQRAQEAVTRNARTMSNFGLPPKPERPDSTANANARLDYQEKLQDYHFALQQALNAITQEGATKSNLQKAAHDAIMQMLSNLR
jgi:hypothetical protein